MINFFRKIRKQLADDNKPLKYARYAIGEIVLVVIGILIALSINNANVERINRLEEKTYLNQLVLNLNRDLQKIMVSSVTHEQRLFVGVQVLDALGKSNLEHFKVGKGYANALKKYSTDKSRIPNSMGGKFWNALKIIVFYKSDIVFQELLSTGKIDIIKNQELKAAIQEHYLDMTDKQNFQDVIVMKIQENFRDALNENNISMKNRKSYSDLKDKLIDTQGLIVALENQMAITEVMLNMFIYGDTSMKKTTESLISQIREELDNAK